jgi:hypothetical protein
MIVTVALGTTAPDGSVTVPRRVPLTACPDNTCVNPKMHRAITDPRSGPMDLRSIGSTSKVELISRSNNIWFEERTNAIFPLRSLSRLKFRVWRKVGIPVVSTDFVDS